MTEQEAFKIGADIFLKYLDGTSEDVGNNIADALLQAYEDGLKAGKRSHAIKVRLCDSRGDFYNVMLDAKDNFVQHDLDVPLQYDLYRVSISRLKEQIQI